MSVDRPVAELRWDPVVGRQVLIAEGRVGRPNDFADRARAGRVAIVPADCPFCAGHEAQTPPALLEVRNPRGDWQVRVVPNKYPAVTWDSGERESVLGQEERLLRAEAPRGVHEVIIESPRHVDDLRDLSREELALVLQVCRDRLLHWAGTDGLQQAMLFKNVGGTAGASLAHTHSQLMVLPHVPPTMQAELQGARRSYEKHGACVYCQLLVTEHRASERMVATADGFAAFAAYAARQPYETWILPTEHAADFGQLTDVQAAHLAGLLLEVMARLARCLPELSYNLVLHTAPFSQSKPGNTEACYHWHWEIIPRSSPLAGLEWGGGLPINSLSPERAAARLRDALPSLWASKEGDFG